jgi:hypothetical protein
MIGLRAAVEEEFGGLTGHFVWGHGMHTFDTLAPLDKEWDRVDRACYPEKGRSRARLWRARFPEKKKASDKQCYTNSCPEDRARRLELDKLRKKESRILPKIEEWKVSATLILLGRDISAKNWIEIFKHPVGEHEVAATIDFAYFLNHRGVQRWQICSMLGISKLQLGVYLESRNVSK